MERILDRLSEPGEISGLDRRQLLSLADELREELLQVVSQTGGHLASNLGVVELTIALLYTLSPPADKIVWDVGHQCYPYKILTGRLEQFHTLRQKDGICGFPKTEESPYDAFVSGHASTSLAVAYGLKRAMTHNEKDGHVVAVIGDGSLTGGMAFEGLNNIGKSKENLIVILNDNEMAISRNDGAIAKYLSIMRCKPGYFKVKRITEHTLQRIPVVGNSLRGFVKHWKNRVKNAIYPSTMFDQLGFSYLGPIDGHNLSSLIAVLEQAKTFDTPTLIHIKTQKGKGYPFSEENPGAFHGVSQFDLETGNPLSPSADSFSAAFGEEITRLAQENPKICAITAAMEHGCCLQYFGRQHKADGRFYDVGIAEEFGVTFAAALAAGDTIPVFAVYSTFLQRGYDQLIHDAAIEKRHIVLAVDRAGIVGEDGETHQGIFDAAFLSTVPQMEIYSPANYTELRGRLRYAIADATAPVAVRYPRGSEEPAISAIPYDPAPFTLFSKGNATKLIVTYGRTFAAAKAVFDRREEVAVLKLNRIFPIAPAAIEAAAAFPQIYFVEEGIRTGGIGMQCLAALSLAGYHGETHLRAIDGFVPHQRTADALAALGLDATGIEALVATTTKTK